MSDRRIAAEMKLTMDSFHLACNKAGIEAEDRKPIYDQLNKFIALGKPFTAKHFINVDKMKLNVVLTNAVKANRIIKCGRVKDPLVGSNTITEYTGVTVIVVETTELNGK